MPAGSAFEVVEVLAEAEERGALDAEEYRASGTRSRIGPARRRGAPRAERAFPPPGSRACPDRGAPGSARTRPQARGGSRVCRGVPTSVRTQADDLAARGGVPGRRARRELIHSRPPTRRAVRPRTLGSPVCRARNSGLILDKGPTRGSVEGGAGLGVCAGVFGCRSGPVPWRSEQVKKEHTVNLSCSFCGKSQREVRKLIAGPTVYICDECIKLCNDIAEEHDREEGKPQVSLPTPTEIKSFLDDYVIGQDHAKKVLAVGSTTTTSASTRRSRRPGQGEGRQARGRRAQRATSSSSVPPAAARPSSPRAWPGSSTSRSPSPTPPASPRLATWARTWRTSSRTSSTTPTTTWRRRPRASSTSTRSTRSPRRRHPQRHPRRGRRGRAAGLAEDHRGTRANVTPRGRSTTSRSTSRSTPRTSSSSARCLPASTRSSAAGWGEGPRVRGEDRPQGRAHRGRAPQAGRARGPHEVRDDPRVRRAAPGGGHPQRPPRGRPGHHPRSRRTRW